MPCQRPADCAGGHLVAVARKVHRGRAGLAQDDGLTGYEAPGLPDAAWVLGGMYERGATAGDSVNDAQPLFGHPDILYTPSNLWATERSWVICTVCGASHGFVRRR